MKEQITKSENPEVFLSFKEVNVQDITMDQLANSYHERNSNGEAPHNIFHDDFINRVQTMCADHGLNTQIYDLFAADRGSSNYPGVSLCQPLIEKYGDFAVKATTLRRIFCNLRVLDFDTDEFTTNLSIAYHQNGIQVGLGNNVKICHNQCMLGKGNYVSTYTTKGNGEKLTANQVLDTVADWIANIKEKVSYDRHIIHSMRNIYVTNEELSAIIGRLQMKRVQYDTKYNEIKDREFLYPLNGTQLNSFTENVLRKALDGQLTLWDVYNCATECYKARTMDIPNIIPQNLEMVSFLDGIYHFNRVNVAPTLLRASFIEDAVIVNE